MTNKGARFRRITTQYSQLLCALIVLAVSTLAVPVALGADWATALRNESAPDYLMGARGPDDSTFVMRPLAGGSTPAWAIRKIGTLGVLQWSKRLDFAAVPNAADYLAVGIAPLPDGGVACLFRPDPPFFGASNLMLLVALDQDGALLWQKQLTVPLGSGFHTASPFAIRLTPSGLLAITGAYQNEPPYGAYAILLSEIGDVVSSVAVVGSNPDEPGFYAIDAKQDGTIVLGGSKTHFAYSDYRISGALVTVLDPSGNVAWSRLYGPGIVYDVSATSSGYRALVYVNPVSGEPGENILLDLGPDGSLLNDYHFGRNPRLSGGTVAQDSTIFHLTTDGGYVQTGGPNAPTPGFIATRISPTGEVVYDEVIQGGSAYSYDILPSRTGSGPAVVIGAYSCGPTEGGLLFASVGDTGESCAPAVPHETPSADAAPLEITEVAHTTLTLAPTVAAGAVVLTDFPAEAVDACVAVCTSECQNVVQPDVTVRRLNINNAKVSVKYSFPSGSTARRLVLRTPAWIDAQGRSYPEQAVYEWPAGDPALSGPGPYAANITVPLGSSRQIEILAEVRYTDPAGGCNARAFGYGAVDAPATANGVSLSDGAMHTAAIDPLPPILGSGLLRSHDSMQGLDGFFGRGWMTIFDQRLNIEPRTGLVRLITADNTIVAFDTTLTQVWPKGASVPDTLTMDTVANEAVYRRAGSSTETRFSLLDGHFAGIRDVITGRRMTMAPTTGPGGVLTGWVAADSLSGITWTVTVSDGLVQTITATSGLAWAYEYNGERNLTRVAGPGGDTWRTYEHTNGLMTASRDAVGKLIESRTYDSDGHVTSAITPLEDVTTIQYALAGPTADSVITRVTPSGTTPTDITLQDIGGAYRPVDHDGTCHTCGARNEVTVRDDRGRVLRRQDASGYVTVYTYTGDHVTRIKSAMRPAGCDPAVSSTQCKLTTAGLTTALLDSTNATLTLDYEFQNTTWPDKPTKITSNSVYNAPNTRRETFTYDAATGQALTREIKGWTASPVAEQTRIVTATLYNGTEGAAFTLSPPLPSGAQPRLPKTIDGPRTDVSDITTFAYYPFVSSVPAGARGRLAATKDAMGHVTRFENYDLFGTPRKITDPNGVVTETTTDSIGRILTRTVKGVAGCDNVADPICGTDLVTTLTYDQFGPLTQQQRPGGGVTTFEYDDRGRPLKGSRGPSSSSLQEQIETVYNADGRVGAQRYLARNGSSWVEKRRADYTYDADGQLDRVTYPDTKFVQYTYDKAGRVKGTKDENHTAPNKTYLYDATGQIRSVEEKLGSGTVSATYTYDAYGNLISATDPNGNVTSWIFDDFSQKLKETSPVSGITTNTYGLGGELLTTTDARNNTTTRTYDALGRITSAVTGGTSGESVAWSYDSAAANGTGRLNEISDPAGVTTYLWSRMGQLLNESRVDNRDSGSNAYETAYDYDVDGNRRRIICPQIPSTTKPPSDTPTTVVYAYDYAGREISATVNNLPFINNATYMPFGGLTAVAFANGLNISRTYDARYRIDLNELSKAGVTIAKYDYDYDGNSNVTSIGDLVSSAHNRTFGYDDLNRLVTANSGTGLWGSGSYTYDAMGNMLSTALGPLTRSLTYQGTTSKLALASESSSVPPGSSTSQTVSHDAAGNETTNSIEEYSVRNRMQAADGRSYAYDGRGIRVREDEGSVYAVPPLRRYWFYSPELTLLATTEYADTMNLPITRTFVWFARMPVAQLDGSTLRYTFSDHLGTPLLQTNSAGIVVWRAEYEPFGKIWSMRAGALSDQPLRFPGQEEAGNAYYNVFRWYRPDWGRFLSVDPVRGDVHLSQSWSWYSYGSNNPLNRIDPDGRDPKEASGDEAQADDPAPFGDSVQTLLARLVASKPGSGWHGGFYQTPDQAAASALADVCGVSFVEQKEYIGQIFRTANAMYSYTSPVRGGSAAADPNDLSPRPYGTTLVGLYHTHPQEQLGALGSMTELAEEDRRTSYRLRTLMYVGLPYGDLWRFDPVSRQPDGVWTDKPVRYDGRLSSLGDVKCQ